MSQTSRTSEAGWTPRTKIGKLVQEGKITSLEEVFVQGQRVLESEIIDVLLPNLRQEVLGIGLVQKQTDAGERSRFKAVVAVGDPEGYLGVGLGKAKQVRTAISKATAQAKLAVIPIKRGCGSWECGCSLPHSLPFKVSGKSGSVTVEIHPGPRGLGLVGGEVVKTVLRLTGIRDCWTRTFGSTNTLTSMAFAIYDALKDSHTMVAVAD
ncbi:MAG: 30S ribosomal protein S5 [Candidatus Bathyarchaeota archaeon]|jgi:small subunit ribosomal protein S5|nr:30S ribosomal protein S5 [Candidatus Bathyarchaeota archaeon]